VGVACSQILLLCNVGANGTISKIVNRVVLGLFGTMWLVKSSDCLQQIAIIRRQGSARIWAASAGFRVQQHHGTSWKSIFRHAHQPHFTPKTKLFVDPSIHPDHHPQHPEKFSDRCGRCINFFVFWGKHMLHIDLLTVEMAKTCGGADGTSSVDPFTQSPHLHPLENMFWWVWRVCQLLFLANCSRHLW